MKEGACSSAVSGLGPKNLLEKLGFLVRVGQGNEKKGGNTNSYIFFVTQKYIIQYLILVTIKVYATTLVRVDDNIVIF